MTERSVHWSEREPPLPITGVLALGVDAAALARRLAEGWHPGASSLRVAIGPDALVVFGSEPDLPWVDGVVWLGHDHGLSCPTTLEPNLPPALVADSVRLQKQAVGHVVCTPEVSLLIAGTSTLPDRPGLLTVAQSFAATQ